LTRTRTQAHRVRLTVALISVAIMITPRLINKIGWGTLMFRLVFYSIPATRSRPRFRPGAQLEVDDSSSSTVTRARGRWPGIPSHRPPSRLTRDAPPPAGPACLRRRRRANEYHIQVPGPRLGPLPAQARRPEAAGARPAQRNRSPSHCHSLASLGPGDLTQWR
jgi:hypothetical protein